jgi:ABC-type multidrug transport system fused ATPase/permease subunit
MAAAGAHCPPSIADEWRAGFLSRSLWWWVGNVIVKGSKQPLELEDVGQLNAGDGAGRAAERLWSLLTHFAARTAAATGARPQITRAVLVPACVVAERRDLLISGCCKLVGDLLGFVGPLAISGIVTFVTATAAGTPVPSWGGMALGYWWMLAVFAAGIVQNFLLQWHHERVMRAGLRVRSALSLLVYRKSLSATAHTLREVGKGQITNLQSADANAVNTVFWYVHYAWASPLMIAICMWLLYNQLGGSAFVGLGVLVCLIPAQGWLGKRIGAHTKAASIAADRRVKLLGEALSGIRIVKLLAYEASFADRIAAARQEELAAKRRVAIVSAINTMLLNAGPMVVALLSFLTYGFSGGSGGATLTPQQAFSSVTLFAILRLPLMVLPMLVSAVASGAVSATRLCAFLGAPDAAEYRVFHAHPLTLALAGGPDPATAAAASAKAAAAAGEAAEGDAASASAVAAACGSPPAALPSIDVASRACSDVWLQQATLTWAAAEVETAGPADGSATAAASGVKSHGAAGRAGRVPGATQPQQPVGQQAQEAGQQPQQGASSHRQAFQLQDVSLAFPADGLTQIVGSVGSGKSSLLSAILGEMTLLGGSVNLVAPALDVALGNVSTVPSDGAAAAVVAVSGISTPAAALLSGPAPPSVRPRIAYASQQPWLLNASVRDNVTFGLPLQWGRYRRILHACALGPDLAAWPAGDATELGEKGVSCSGGQKARVSLARAIYAATYDPAEGDEVEAGESRVGMHLPASASAAAAAAAAAASPASTAASTRSGPSAAAAATPALSAASTPAAGAATGTAVSRIVDGQPSVVAPVDEACSAL